MNDPTILKRVYPNLYLFLDDVRIFLITYNVITTYFRRSSRTAICGFISDQILFFIYKTYFLPIIQDDNKGKRVVNRKIKEISKKEFTKENIFLSLTKAKRTKLTNLIESPELTKENFVNKNKLDLLLSKNKQEMDIKILTEIQFVITKIKIRKLEHESYKSSKKLEITFQDFVSEICYFSNSDIKHKENNKINMDLEISIFKIKLGERFVSAFETEKIIKNKWKNGKINIDIFNNNNSSSYDREAISLDFNENIIQENIDKITNILPTSLPMICQPNKWSDSEYGGYLNNSIEKNKLITGLGINNDHTIQNLDKLYNSINYLNSIKFRINTEVLEFIINNKKKVFENYYQCENKLNDNINDNVLRDAVTLEIAKIFYNIPFYLNTYADWRGRIYTASYYLSYQGSSLSLSLIQFDEGQII